MDKLVLFGAGRIGRSFIGQLFSRSGFEVVFVDINKVLIDELNRRRQYDVIIKAEKDKKIIVQNVRGVYSTDINVVCDEIADALIVCVSVGLRGLPDVMKVLAKGLLMRYETGNNVPVDIIIAENMRNAASYFHEQLARLLPGYYPLDRLVGLIETSIGKMVPIMPQKDIEEDMLRVYAEPYNTLILDKRAFKNSIPDVEGLDPKDNMKAWTDRKLFIHNLGHASVAYYGFIYDKNLTYIWQALDVPEIYKFVRNTMLQAADILMAAWSGEFSMGSLSEHIDDLLYRFRNKALGDTIYRVGCDLKRKLGPDDRIVGAIRVARSVNMPYDSILKVLLSACHFRATDENGRFSTEDTEFIRLYEEGIRNVLIKVCGFIEEIDKDLIDTIETMENNFINLCKKFSYE
jgi:mannitol-1-phosphate 5-dehydrogenase